MGRAKIDVSRAGNQFAHLTIVDLVDVLFAFEFLTIATLSLPLTM